MLEIPKKTEKSNGSLLTGKRLGEILVNPTEESLGEIDDMVKIMREMPPEDINKLRPDTDLAPLLDFTLLLNEIRESIRRKSGSCGSNTEKEFREKLILTRKNAGLVFRGKQEGYWKWRSMGIDIPLYRLDQGGDLDLVPTIRIDTTVCTVILYMHELTPADSRHNGIVWSENVSI